VAANKNVKEALLYETIDGKKTRCNACNHRCIITENKRGICGVRENRDGKLYSLVYGKIIAEHIDPIEKKPLYHFMPGTFSLSIATVGCNFRCLHCQNADISQQIKNQKSKIKNQNFLGEDKTPEQIIQDALDNKCPSISYTYTEPTIFVEYALDCMKLAKGEELRNVWVSNGYMTKETLDLVDEYLDAVNIDLKAFSEEFYQNICGARLKPILENLIDIKKRRIWLEVTTLIIPGKNDSEKELKQIAEFIKKELGDDTPWHVSRFFPYYKMKDAPPTPVEKIYEAVEIGKKAGLRYVYPGNV